MRSSRPLIAEVIGTFWLVFGGCGSAVLAAAFPDLGIGLLGVSLAFGLTIVSMGYALGPISGCHLNPAVTVGLWIARRIPGRIVVLYVGAQLLGAVAATAVLLIIATGQPDFNLAEAGFAQNGYGAGSPGGYSACAAFIIEFVLTAGFIFVILGSTDVRAANNLAPITIGFALTLIHLISIPVTNTSVNPARSTGPALVVGGLALEQLWLFWLAPICGGVFGGLGYRALVPDDVDPSRDD